MLCKELIKLKEKLRPLGQILFSFIFIYFFYKKKIEMLFKN
jgi:hypothetical protein